MKKTLSLILALVMLLSVFAGVMPAFASETELTFNDKTNNKSYTFTITDDDLQTPVKDFVASKLGVDREMVHVVFGSAVVDYGTTTVMNEFCNRALTLKNAGFEPCVELYLEYLWGTGDNYDADWLGDYDNTTEYHIGNAYELAAFKKACFIDCKTFEGKTVYIDNDIDLSAHIWMIEGTDLLSENFPRFCGVLDGQDNSVFGLKMYPATCTAGFLPYIDGAAVENLSVYGEAKRSNLDFLGLLIGYAKDSAIYNCYANGKIFSVGRDACYYAGAVGGLIGEAHHCAVMNCGSYVDLSLKYENVIDKNYGYTYPRIGGLIGRVTNKGQDSYCVINSYSQGWINIENALSGDNTYVGGLFGYCDDDIYNCYTKVDFVGVKNIKLGAVAGEIHLENIVTDYTTGETTNLGQYIVDRVYYDKGSDCNGVAFGSVTDNTAERNAENMATCNFNWNNIKGLIKEGVPGVEDIITAHRDILSGSSWAELVEQCKADSFIAFDWVYCEGTNLPEFRSCNHYDLNCTNDTEGEGKTLYYCLDCNAKFVFDDRGALIESGKFDKDVHTFYVSREVQATDEYGEEYFFGTLFDLWKKHFLIGMVTVNSNYYFYPEEIDTDVLMQQMREDSRLSIQFDIDGNSEFDIIWTCKKGPNFNYGMFTDDYYLCYEMTESCPEIKTIDCRSYCGLGYKVSKLVIKSMEDASGYCLKPGWVKDRGKWFYLDENLNLATGWLNDRGKWYYLDEDGVMQTGWVKDNGKWYFLSSSGAMRTGWVKYGGKWYYLSASGAMKTGWVKDNGKWYYLSTSGAMKTGWLKDNGKWYYLGSSGAMATGWLKDNDKWYYLNTDGSMRTENLTYKGKVYKFNSSGVCLNP